MALRVPYVPDDVIERDAEALLGEFAHARGIEVRAPIPIEDIVEKHLKLHVEFDDLHRLLDVPRSGLGLDPDMFGAIWLEAGRIVIDESLDPEERPEREGRYRFTLAHEGGGHWRLHRPLVRPTRDQGSLLIDAARPTVVCRSSQAKERAEWQADFFINAIDLKPYVTGTAQPKMNQAKMNSIPVALPPLGTARKTSAAQFPAIELHLGGWRSGRHLPATV